MISISAVVCTDARPDLARRAIRSLVEQDYPRSRFEILLVTSSLPAAPSRSAMRLIDEPHPGLARARNRALTEARSPVVAYLDDDAIAEPGWLHALARAYEEERDADAVGGRIDLEWTAPRPEWWRPELDDTFNRLDLSENRTRLFYPRYPYGTNLSLRVDTARRLGGFREDLGRANGRLLAGEEAELLLRIEKAGGTVLFEPRARVRHLAPADRATRGYVRRRAFWHGYSHAAFERRLLPRAHSWNRYVTLATLPVRSLLEARFGIARQAEWLFVAGYSWQALTHPFGTTVSEKGPIS
jgi:glycosyltransferase involved in cell wall biosynthesis